MAKKHKFISWHNWWRGLIISALLGFVGFLVNFVYGKIGSGFLLILFVVLGVVFVPLIYYQIVKLFY